MTSLGLQWLAHKENVRANQAKEFETNRSNVAQETETNRSNLAREAETQRSNLAKEAETNRHNLVTESQTDVQLTESKRHNQAMEMETNRSNLAREAETNRSNLAAETNNRIKSLIPHVPKVLQSTVASTLLASGLSNTEYDQIQKVLNEFESAKDDVQTRAKNEVVSYLKRLSQNGASWKVRFIADKLYGLLNKSTRKF